MRKDVEERVRLEREIAKRPSSRNQLTAVVRQAAIAYTRRRVTQGASRAMIARELGVTPITVSRWIAMGRGSTASSTTQPERAKKLRPVRVVDAKRAMTSAIVATTRDGLRIEGLNVADLAALLRALA